MGARVIERSQLGTLTKIGQGGQGVVYRAPNVTTHFADSMVYKEYKTTTGAPTVDYTALAAMPALVEQTLTAAQARRLVSIAAWPCALVEDSGTPVGFVMPAIAERYFTSLTTVKGTYDTTAEFQHLLNHPSMLAARGITINDAQRYALLREIASALVFLHQHGVCVGDLSPKNLLYSLAPREAVYFIDCDAMRVEGTSALPQLETPGWQAPDGEELATVHSDTYKLGLLALRLVAGDQDTRDPRMLGPGTPTLLRQLITDTLTKEPQSRPPLEAWSPLLARALEQAQSIDIAAAASSDPAAEIPAPAIPVVRSRPQPQLRQLPIQSAMYTASPPPPLPAHVGRSARPAVVGGVLVGLLLILGIIVTIGMSQHSSKTANATTSTSPSPTHTPTHTSTYTSPPAPPPPPPPPERWVAIAVSSEGDWGSSANDNSRDEAESDALTGCRKHATDCEVMATNDNGCVAVAWGATRHAGGHGTSLTEAENDALSSVGGSILVSKCTDPS